MINAQYLPEAMNRDTNPQFWAACSASKWKLNPIMAFKVPTNVNEASASSPQNLNSFDSRGDPSQTGRSIPW